MLVKPSDNDRIEWARMSRALPLGAARNTYATLAIPERSKSLRIQDYDFFQAAYRKWLVFNVIPVFPQF